MSIDGAIRVLSRYKPAQVYARAEARLETTADRPAGVIIDAGLAELGETRAALWGWGILARSGVADTAILPPGVYTVFADRD